MADNLKEELQQIRQDLEQLKATAGHPVITEESVTKVVKVLQDITKQQKSNEKLAIKEESLFQRAKVEAALTMDSREKLFQAAILVLCIAVLSILAFYDKLLGVSPVLGVVIGLVMGKNSVGRFLMGIRQSSTQGDLEESE